MTNQIICIKYVQSNINGFLPNFDGIEFQTTSGCLATFIDEYNGKEYCQKNTFFNCQHRQDYSWRTDPYNARWIPEERDECSRADIKKVSRLGDGF